MKILIAIGVPRQKEAGAAGVVLNHALELQKLGHSVECWFLDDVLKRPRRPQRLESLLFAAAAAKRILRERNRFDVVNLHAPWGCVYGIWRRLFHLEGSPPYVMTMQGSEERFVTAMRIEHRKGRASNFAWLNRAWHRLYHQTMYNYSIETADYGMVAAREGCILAEVKHQRESGRIWFVPNGTEERFFLRRSYEGKKPLRLLFVGTWLYRKGIHYLAEAFAQLAARNADLQLTVAGCVLPEEAVRKFFPAQMQSRIQVIPFVRRDDMPELYAEHDIYFFPSLVEGMPLTLLEAMATGMPVVTTNSSGMADVVEDEVNGLLVPAADTASLVEATDRLCSSVELREKLGSVGQETMRRYTWEKIARRLEKVLALAVRNASV
jgi:glycosyltransferase involved in cell wall biosynthesis